MLVDPQGYPIQQYTDLKNNIVLEIMSDGTIVLATGITLSSGSGSPEGIVTAPIGSFYIDKNGISPNIWFQKQTGVGNTGWQVVANMTAVQNAIINYTNHGQLPPAIAGYDTSGIVNCNVGDNALYTVPVGKLAFFKYHYNNSTNVGTVNVFPTIKPNGSSTIYRINSVIGLTAPPNNNSENFASFAPAILASQGDVLGLNCLLVGVNVNVEIVLIDLTTSGYKQILFTTIVAGNNTVYTVPVGKTGYFGYSIFSSFGTTGNTVLYSNQSGAASTWSLNIVPNGDSPNATNKVLQPTANLADQSAQTIIYTKKMAAGDFVNLSSSRNGQQLFSAVVFEQ